MLCNACGINYRRALTMAKGQVDLDELARSMGSISPNSRPSIHKTLKRQRAAAAAAAGEAAAAEAAAAASSSRKRQRYNVDPLPPFETLVRSIPDSSPDARPP